jgi:Kef-type K+ transport system membrane component KefB
MSSIYLIASFWFLAAVVSTILANRLKISMALMEIIVGALIGFLAFKLNYTDKLSLDDEWLNFSAGVGAILLTFLSWPELIPDIKRKMK